jgi:hypothetical protein
MFAKPLTFALQTPIFRTVRRARCPVGPKLPAATQAQTSAELHEGPDRRFVQGPWFSEARSLMVSHPGGSLSIRPQQAGQCKVRH